jgi:adenine-specific DNA-methyltransferase
MTFLTDSTDIARIHLSSGLNIRRRSKLGQFLTPATISRFMAGQFSNLAGQIRLLEPCAGVGSLITAFVECLLTSPNPIESCFITAYEIESSFLSSLEHCLIERCIVLEKKGIKANYCLREKNFIEAAAESTLPLFPDSNTYFTHAILNPPYKKINSQSVEKKILSSLRIETVNLYSAFVWLTMLRLSEDGEMVAITPRSFCNGAYFRPFRKSFLNKMGLRKIHVLKSRSVAFEDDDVLQENIIFHAIKTNLNPGFIEITNHSGNALDEFSETRCVPYSEVVGINDTEQFIHIITNSL